ncbi:pseudouridine synthase [Deefgea rivuli]|uniref:pseudouridine synthase n=1 Tax=Deefgea rivuli TaxID=400948 RepID=UPI000488AF1D|nr:pseudouridine synthase [Deefgea rivuli]
MPKLILFNKPYGVICQFSPSPPHQCLADFITVKDVYAAGRLDTDSEGLLLLTDNGALQHKITDPKHKLVKTYWVQVEGIPDEAALAALRQGGLDLGDFKTQPAEASVIEQPELVWPRVPPIRERVAIPTSWLEIKISEGKNRQVRRMTAKVGYPTLRLIRYAIGGYTLDGIELGQIQTITVAPVHVPNPNPKAAGKPKQRGRRGPNKVR